jgi:Tfp pilus assembly protein PilE
MFKFRNKKGITFLELLIVFIVLALLAAIAVNSVYGWVGFPSNKVSAATLPATQTVENTGFGQSYAGDIGSCVVGCSTYCIVK